MESIAIIIVNYNNYEDTIKCVNSIRENEKKIKYEIILVDNASTNNSIEELSKIEGIVLINNKRNGGFAFGNNIGIKYAIDKNFEYIMLLNNDTEIEKNSISKLVNCLKNKSNFKIIAPRIMYYYDKEKINSIGGKISKIKCIGKWEEKNKKYKEKYHSKFEEKDIITGCCMLFTKELIEKVGFLDEEYFMYYEDLDFCTKIKKAGYKIGIDFDSIIYHKESASSGGKENPFAVRWNTRNRLIFIEKYSENKMMSFIFFYISRVIVYLKYIMQGKKKLAKALKEGIKDGRENLKKI